MKQKKTIKRENNISGGYTLIELVVVMTIVAILTGAISVSVEKTNQDTRLSNAIYRALSDVRYAQELAMTNRREVSMWVNPGEDRYYFKWQDTGDYLENPVDGGDFIITFNTGEYQGVDITSSGMGGRLSFTATGYPLINGANFGTTDGISVMQLNNGYHIFVYQSGLTTIEESAGGGGCAGAC